MFVLGREILTQVHWVKVLVHPSGWFPFATWVKQLLPTLVLWPKNEGELNPQTLLKNQTCLHTGIPISIYFHSTMRCECGLQITTENYKIV
jgi:hypothetical protein